MKKLQKIVIKIGTSTLTQGTKKLSRKHMVELVRQMANLQAAGHQVILVSSGAIAAGREALQNIQVDQSVPAKQMLAAVGQGRLMQVWSELFSVYEIPVGQVLLTRDDFSDRQRYLNIRDTFNALLFHRIIPIINENDTVATEEIKVGDNDNLSALVANLVSADILILLTDQQGLYTADPRNDPQAQLIPIVDHIDDSIRALAGGTSKTLGLGTGGMSTKVQAAYLASQSGIPTVIASAAVADVLPNLINGARIGTLFLAATTPRESRKQWLVSKKSQGTITVDEGAETRLCHQGASLLAVGITQINQIFERGSIVHVVTTTGKQIAVGITNYSSEDIQKLKKTKSAQIVDVLGYSYGQEIIHRDNMALMKSASSQKEIKPHD